MRVLHVIPSVSPVHGGPSHAIAVMERALSEQGIAVTTATTDDDGPRHRLSHGDRPQSQNGAARIYARKLLDPYKVAPGIAVWLWRNVHTYDVVHIHALFSFTSIVAGLAARWRRVPYVIRPLGSLAAYGVVHRRPWLKRLSLAMLEGPLLRRAAAVHFTSRAEWDEAGCLGIPMRAVVIPLGVEPSPPGDAESIGSVNSRLRGRRAILFLSRLDPVKNIEALLQALALLRSREASVVLLVAGGGRAPYLAILEELVRQLGLEEHVIWLGHVEGERKAALLGAADVFVLPSHSESFGIAAVEALLAGVPCILSRGVAIAGDIERAHAGLVVEPDAKAIATALGDLLADNIGRRELGERGRRFAQREYSTRAMCDRLLDLYRDVIAPPAPRVA